MNIQGNITDRIPQKYKNYKHLLTSKFFTFFYGHPSAKLAVIGVTGTDGKTTTSTLIYEILKEAGYKVGMVSTISAYIGDEIIPTGFHVTTPSPRLLHSLLKKMVDQGIEYVVLETTSHGLDQYRIGSVHFHAGVYTNVTSEHLDYHKTYEAYLNTKAKLIELISPGGFVVINRNDSSAQALITKAGKHKIKSYTYALNQEADLSASNYRQENRSTKFAINWQSKKYEITLNLPGEYNVSNALAAILVGLELRIDPELINRGISKVKSLEGRWEIIKEEPFKTVVDFAHTPNSLEKMLTYAREDNNIGRVIVIFGCAGKRDINKRSAMGEIAGKLADLVILTAEDPRGESVTNINRQIGTGLNSQGKIEGTDYFSVDDRAEAIALGVNLAKPGDTLIISGKGHEKSMNIDGTNEIPWSDQSTVRTILESYI